MTKYGNLLFFLLLLLPCVSWAQQSKKADYEAGTVIFKLKSAPASTYNNRYTTSAMPDEVAEKLKKKVGGVKVAQPFPAPKNAKNHKNVQRQVSSALDGIFKMQLPAGLSVEEVVEILKQDPQVQYAEPYYLPQLLEVPNDPKYTNQAYLPVIKAPAAWEIQKGNADIIIGIIDTGVDFNHADLQDNLYLNTNDPIDGIDNDGDGYVDNYRGWDFANNDNNPTADKNGHGTMVTGICASSTNNAVSIAGTGYNTRYMPIKVFSSVNDRFIGGYEAIVYAANMGCKIINLSWGSPSAPSEYVQDIIRYAVEEKDAVVVAAAGNTAQQLDFYPASYKNVLSVAGSTNTDTKTSWATWSRYVDMVAPGNVYTTSNGGGNTSTWGSSFSSPMVAGAAALVRARYPELTAQQVMERMRRSADDIYANGNNATYFHRLGTGRLNMEKALQSGVGPAVRMTNYAYTNGIGSYAFHKDTVEFRMNFINYLEPTSDVKVKLISESSYATVLNAEAELGQITTLQQASNNDTPFKVYLHPDLPALAFLSFKLEFTNSNGYTDYQYFDFRSSGEYIDFKVDDLTLTVASNGNLGYNYDYNLQGLGLRYQDAPLAHNMGLLIAQNSKAIANNVINYAVPAVRDQDFRTTDRLRLYANSPATIDARSSFEVVQKDGSRLNLRVDQRILGWSDASEAASVVLEYRIQNLADTAYKNLHVALFADFNLNDFYLNRANWDELYKLGYTYDNSTGRYAGIALISGQPLLYHAVDLNTREGNIAEMGESLSRLQKWEFISNGVDKETAGLQGKGNDVAKFLGGTISSLAAKKADKVVFVMVTAPTLDDLKAAIDKATNQYNIYNSTPPQIARVSTIETCSGLDTKISLLEGNSYLFFADAETSTPIAEGETFTFAPLQKDTVLYAVNVDDYWASELEQINIMVSRPAADFSMSASTILLNNGQNETIEFTGVGPEATEWLWDFGDGTVSNDQSPSHQYTQAGTYVVKMKVTTAEGCNTTLSRNITVNRKEDLPLVETLKVCYQTAAVIRDENGRNLNVYADETLQNLVYSGIEFSSEPLDLSKSYYVTAGTGVEESDALAVNIAVFRPSLLVTHEQILSNDHKYALSLSAQVEADEAVTGILWYDADNTLVGTGEEIIFSYNAQSSAPAVRVEVSFENGCSKQIEQQLPLLPSAAPQLQDVVVCRGESALIAPKQDGIYYFYADSKLEFLMGKGRSHTISDMIIDQHIYVTSLTGGLESQPVKVEVHIADRLAAFELATTTMPLSIESPVQFTSSSQYANSWTWTFGDGQTSTEQNPEHVYTAAGTYTVSLTATSAFGCSETREQLVVIVAPQGLSENSNRLQVYPNPTNGEVSFQMPENLQPNASIMVLSAAGKQILQQQAYAGTAALNLEAFPKGMYLIRLVNGRQVWQSRVVVQ